MNEPPPGPAVGRGAFAPWLSLVLLCGALYAPTLRNGFTIDDGFAYAANGFLADLRNLPALFDQRYFQFSNEASYRPICTLSYFLDRALWKDNAVGPHLTQVLLFTATVLLLYALCRALLRGDRTAAWIGAAIFALHPVHTEVVNNIGFREDLLVGLFVPASWLLFRQALRDRPWRWTPLALLAAGAALFSKESAIVLPALAGVLWWLDPASRERQGGGGALRRRALCYFAGLAGLTVLFLLVRFLWMRFPLEAGNPRLGGSLAGTLLANVKIQAWYLVLLVFPVRLLAHYPPALFAPVPDGWFFIALAVLLLFAAALLFCWRSPRLIAASLWWFVSLAPVANFYPIYNPMAERYLYLASIGPCLWAGSALAAGLRSRWRQPILWVASATALLWGLQTFTRARDWRDNLAVWTPLARQFPEDPTILLNLASSQFEARDYGGAYTNSALALAAIRAGGTSERTTTAYLCLGSCLLLQGETGAALEALHRAEWTLPARFDIDFAVYRNLGLAYDEQGETAIALDYYRKAARADSFQAEVWQKLAVAALGLGRREEAEAAWSNARRLNPGLPAFDVVAPLVRRAAAETNAAARP